LENNPTQSSFRLAGVRLIIPDHTLGSPVFRTLSLCTCCRHYPGAAAGRTTSLVHPDVSAFPERVVGSACASSFSRFVRRSLALRPGHSRCHQFVTRISEGFSYFVTSIAAPVASAWSGRRVGFAPTGKRRLVTAHTRFGHGDSENRVNARCHYCSAQRGEHPAPCGDLKTRQPPQAHC
jgi:hypothetical protein